jgi:hypothetical protein
MVFPQAMFPAATSTGAEWLLPLIIFGSPVRHRARRARLSPRHRLDGPGPGDRRAGTISIAAGAL